jgi:hypothetical protein
MFYVPESQVMENLPVIWAILEQVVTDWQNISKEFSTLHLAKENIMDPETLNWLRPRLFKCLYSYVIFFFMLENGYHFVYSELNHVNNDLDLRVKHNKPPKRTEFIISLWKLRNFTIAHWAGTEKSAISDSITGRQWGYAFMHSVRFDKWVDAIEHIVPGFSGVTIASISETHNRCTEYLSEFDHICTEYLKGIILQMPKTKNGLEYHGWRWTEAGLVSTR